MVGLKNGIIRHNIRVFYVLDILRALWFLTSIWVAYERQYLTISQLMQVEAFILLCTLVMQLPTGAFADLCGKRIALIAGCLLYACSFILYSAARTFPVFLVYAAFSGLASAFIDGTREALLYDTLKQEGREQTFSFMTSKLSMVFQLALACATLIGGWIGSFSFLLPIQMTSAVFLLAAIVSLFFREPVVDTEKFSIDAYISKTRQGVKELFKSPYVKKLSLYYILIGSLTWVCVITFNMMLLNELSYTPAETGMTLATARILNGVVLFGLIRTGRFFTRKRTFILLPIILVISLLPSFFMTKWFAILPVMGVMFVSAARWILLSRYTNAEFVSRNRATAISALCMAIGIVYVIVVGISGIYIERFGGIRTIYTVLGIIALCTALPLGIHLAKNYAH